LGRSILISTPRGWYREISSGILAFAHTRTPWRRYRGLCACSAVLQY